MSPAGSAWRRCQSRRRAPPPGYSRRSTSTTCRRRGAGASTCIAPGHSSKWRARSSGARKRIGRRRWRRRWRRPGTAWGDQSARPTVAAAYGAGAGAVARGVRRSLSVDQLSRLPVDALDLKTVAALAPGVLALAATDSTEADFSVAGQRPTANAITLDVLALGSGSVPQDALRSSRVVTSSYDAARGQFSGGLVASTTRSGKNLPQGSFTYTLRDRSLAWGEATASPFGQGYT